MLELTEKRLNIVHVLARKFCHDRASLREELVSVGNLALCQAAHDHDATKGATPDTWLYGKVKWAMYDYTNLKRPTNRTRWMKMWQFGQLPTVRINSVGQLSYRRRFEDSIIGREPPSSERLEQDERVKELVAPLNDNDRMLFLAVVIGGLMIREAAEELGLKYRTAHHRMTRCREILSKHLQGVVT